MNTLEGNPIQLGKEIRDRRSEIRASEWNNFSIELTDQENNHALRAVRCNTGRCHYYTILGRQTILLLSFFLFSYMQNLLIHIFSNPKVMLSTQSVDQFFNR